MTFALKQVVIPVDILRLLNRSLMLSFDIQFIYLGSNISSTENNDSIRIGKARKSDLSDQIKLEFYQDEAMSVLLNGCTIWTLMKRPEKKLDGNYTRMLRVVLNKLWKQQLTKR